MMRFAWVRSCVLQTFVSSLVCAGATEHALEGLEEVLWNLPAHQWMGANQAREATLLELQAESTRRLNSTAHKHPPLATTLLYKSRSQGAVAAKAFKMLREHQVSVPLATTHAMNVAQRLSQIHEIHQSVAAANGKTEAKSPLMDTLFMEMIATPIKRPNEKESGLDRFVQGKDFYMSTAEMPPTSCKGAEDAIDGLTTEDLNLRKIKAKMLDEMVSEVVLKAASGGIVMTAFDQLDNVIGKLENNLKKARGQAMTMCATGG